MTIYLFFIYDRYCNCIYQRDYDHSKKKKKINTESSLEKKKSIILDGSINKNNNSNETKLLFGMFHSLKTVTSKLVNQDDVQLEKNVLKSFSFGQYKVHFYESLTELKFVILTDISVTNLDSILWTIYSVYYLKNIVYNPLSNVEFTIFVHDSKTKNSKKKKDQFYIDDPNFIEETDDYLKSLHFFFDNI